MNYIVIPVTLSYTRDKNHKTKDLVIISPVMGIFP